MTFVPQDLIDNNAALVQIIAWRQIGDKPLSEQILTQFTWRIYASLGGDELTSLLLGDVDIILDI